MARHKDPKTGLPYYNAYAFKEIQKLTKGNFKWSKLLNTWVGNGTDAAQGVPGRFTRPETEEEIKERLERKKEDEQSAEEEKRKLLRLQKLHKYPQSRQKSLDSRL